MKLTRNLLIFAAVNAVISVAFFYLLNAGIADEAWGQVTALAIAYFFTWSFTGVLLGMKDDGRHHRSNLGLMYHLVATVIVAVTSIWGSAFLSHLDWTDTVLVLGFMGASLLSHWLATRNSIKGIDKKDAFT